MRGLVLAMIPLLILVPWDASLGGKLRDVEEEIDKKDRPPAKPPEARPAEPRCERESEKDSSELSHPSDEFALLLLAAPFWVPAAALDDDWASKPLAPYPYAQEDRTWAFRASFEEERVSGEVRGDHFSLGVRTSSRLGADFSRSHYQEDLETEDDALDLTSAHLTYDIGRSERWTFSTGLGWKEIAGERRRDGVDFVYRVAFLPRKPFILDASVEAAPISGLWLVEYRLGAGIAWRNLELRAGYRALIIGGEDLSGPEIGVSIRF